MRRGFSSSDGYSLLEMVFTVGIVGVLGAMAIVQMGASRERLKGDAAMRIVSSQLNQARQMAIGQRKYIRVTFDVPANEINIIREDTTTQVTVLATLPFEGGARYALVTGVPDTPDAFGRTWPTMFTSTSGAFQSATGNAQVIKFSPDGQLVDWNGRAANGTIFVAMPGLALSARAVTVMGSTGRIRSFRWDGRNWNVV